MNATEPPRPFQPDWTLAPGISLRAILKHRGMTAASLARKAGLDAETVMGVLKATVPVDDAIATRIGDATRTNPEFWLNYQRHYEADLARGATDSTPAHLEGKQTPGVFTCPCCGAVSPHPMDIEQRYCARCHWWTGDPDLGPPHLMSPCRARAGHDGGGLRE